MTKRVEMLVNILIFAAIIYAVIIILAYVFQSRMVFFPSAAIYGTPRDMGLDFEEISIETGDNISLNGWFVPAENAQITFLFCHGNAGNISSRVEAVEQFHSLNLNVLIFDYRGYGKSEGSPSEKGFYRDAEAAWDYLVNDRKIDPHRIIIFGRSLGGAVATWLAIQKDCRALIVESSFLSIPAIGAHHYPYLPVRWLSRFHFDTKSRISQINCPLLIVHSPGDKLIPFRHAQELYKMANEPKSFLEISGAHNDGYLTSGKDYTDGIISFIENLEN